MLVFVVIERQLLVSKGTAHHNLPGFIIVDALDPQYSQQLQLLLKRCTIQSRDNLGPESPEFGLSIGIHTRYCS